MRVNKKEKRKKEEKKRETKDGTHAQIWTRKHHMSPF